MSVRTLGKNFYNPLINGSAMSFATLIAPESNPYGLILRVFGSGAAGIALSLWDKAPPKGTDRSDRSTMRIPVDITLYNDLLIPAGMGLFLHTASSNYSIPVFMSWDYLNADGTVA